MTKTLILGSRGLVGRALGDHLRRSGQTVNEMDIVNAPEQDIRRGQLPLEGIETVYLLAWEVGGAKFLYRKDTQVAQLEWNLDIMRNVFPQLAEQQVRTVFVSSQLAQDVDSVYGVTKRLGELWCRHANAVAIRLWNAYGPIEAVSDRSHVVSDFVVQAVESRTIRMLTRGQELRRFVHVDDIAVGLQVAAEDDSLQGDAWDLASHEAFTIREVADVIAQLTGATVVEGDLDGTEAPFESFRNVPGWAPRKGLHEGIRSMVDKLRRDKDKEDA